MNERTEHWRPSLSGNFDPETLSGCMIGNINALDDLDARVAGVVDLSNGPQNLVEKVQQVLENRSDDQHILLQQLIHQKTRGPTTSTRIANTEDFKKNVTAPFIFFYEIFFLLLKKILKKIFFIFYNLYKKW